jgi:K+-transporting ATPase ATPase B chain
MSSRPAARPLFEAAIVKPALWHALVKLDPRRMIRAPVMFVVELGSAFTTLLFIHALATGAADTGFIGGLTAWLWLTVWFANFAEAMAEGRGKAQAAALRKARQDVLANRRGRSARSTPTVGIPSSQLTPACWSRCRPAS